MGAPTPGTPGGVSRRRALVGGGAAVGITAVAASAGAVLGAVLTKPATAAAPPPQAPDVLRAAIAREKLLIATVDAAPKAGTAPTATLHAIRADHEAHLAALGNLAFRYPGGPATGGTTPAAAPSGTADSLAAVEQRAASAFMPGSAGRDPELAALLASIAACEQSHLALLT